MRILNVILLSCLLLTASCTGEKKIRKDFSIFKTAVGSTFVPDKKVAVFAADLSLVDKKWLLSGETTSDAARQKLITYADGVLGKGNYQNELTLLPDESLGQNRYGIIRLSTAHLRAVPSNKAEMIDQVLMGHTVKVLKKSRDWYLVQTEYDYIGWITIESVHRTDMDSLTNWSKSEKVRVNVNHAIIYSSPDQNSVPVTDSTLNAVLKLHNKGDKWTKVALADGRQGFIENAYVAQVDDFPRTTDAITKSIIAHALSMTGVPYLWGGNSSKANDCSGFVQNVFRASGIELPRDARQQAQFGTLVNYGQDYQAIRPGDLLFFGTDTDIVHVGISMGQARFIHQSGDVHINSLDPNDSDFNSVCKQTLRKVKRIIEEPR